MPSSLLRTIILLPGTTLIFIPALILWLASGTDFSHQFADPTKLQFWQGMLLAVAGILLAAWTVRLQLTLGGGTPAPWDPTTTLVLQGPYRHVRNPMITGAFLILLGEILLFQSWPLAGWFLLFLIFNLIYIPLVEEKELEKRFGKHYQEYKAHVPRWIPRLNAWKGNP